VSAMKSQVNLDKVGAYASAICAVHCLLTGVALGLLSIIGLGFIGSVPAEIGFISVAVLVGSWAIVHGIRKHHSLIPALIFVMGLTFIALSHFAFPHHHSVNEPPTLGHTFSTIFAVLGGLSLVSFHLVNLRLQKGCECGHCIHKE
jgi:hypothetical protein